MSRAALPLILLLSGLLALGYARAMPVGGAPDEAAHVQYVRVLATEGRLPALDLTRRRDVTNDPNYESHQPPLYYALAVPFFAAGRALAGETGAAQGCRLLSILICLAGTALVWLLAREVAPERPALRLAAAGLAAFLPMRLAVAASVSNDALAEATCSLALLLMLRALDGPWGWRQAAGLGAALAAALLAKQSTIVLLPAALATIYLASKAGAARGAAAPPAAPAKDARPAAGDRRGAGKGRRSSPAPKPNGNGAGDAAGEAEALRRFLLTGGIVLAGVLVLSGWWFARNSILYGDPLGQRAFNWYFSDTPLWADFKNQGFTFGRYLGQLVLPTTFATFWGAFGHLAPDHPELFMGYYRKPEGGLPLLALPLQLLWPVHGYPPRSWVYPLLVLAVVVSAAGGILYLARQRKGATGAVGGEPDSGRAKLPILGLHGLFVVATFFNFNATYFQAQGRYLFPAIGFFALAQAGGWLEWARRRELILARVIVGIACVLALYALFGVLGPAFGPAAPRGHPG